MLWCSRKLVTPLECALTKNAPANPLESALTNSLDLKPFGMNRCKKGGGRGGTVPALAAAFSRRGPIKSGFSHRLFRDRKAASLKAGATNEEQGCQPEAGATNEEQGCQPEGWRYK